MAETAGKNLLHLLSPLLSGCLLVTGYLTLVGEMGGEKGEVSLIITEEKKGITLSCKKLCLQNFEKYGSLL